MSNSIANRIQIFVAGALALMGFRALVWVPHYVVAKQSACVLGCIAGGLALPVGIAILLRRQWAVRLAELYLLLRILAACYCLLASMLHFLPPGASPAGWDDTFDLVIPLCLLSLLVWSRFPRCGTSTEPAACS